MRKTVKCPACGVPVKPGRLEKHICLVHGLETLNKLEQTAREHKTEAGETFGLVELSLFLFPRKRKKKGKTRKIGNSSLFFKSSKLKLTEAQLNERERIARRGFHEGASVAGSHLRKIDK